MMDAFSQPGMWDHNPFPEGSLLRELNDVMIAYDVSRDRSIQRSVGPSEIGVMCQQRLARSIANAPRQPVTRPQWAARQGTALHVEMDLILAFWNEQLGRQRWLTSTKVRASAKIKGTSDALDTDSGTVVDWKNPGLSVIEKLTRAQRLGKPAEQQMSPQYRIQAHMYGLGYVNAGYHVRAVKVAYLARHHDFAASAEWTEVYRPEVAQFALDRYDATEIMLMDLDVANHPDRITEVPLNAKDCFFCPYSRRHQPSSWEGCGGTPGVGSEVLGPENGSYASRLRDAVSASELSAIWREANAAGEWTPELEAIGKAVQGALSAA